MKTSTQRTLNAWLYHPAACSLCSMPESNYRISRGNINVQDLFDGLIIPFVCCEHFRFVTYIPLWCRILWAQISYRKLEMHTTAPTLLRIHEQNNETDTIYMSNNYLYNSWLCLNW